MTNSQNTTSEKHELPSEVPFARVREDAFEIFQSETQIVVSCDETQAAMLHGLLTRGDALLGNDDDTKTYSLQTTFSESWNPSNPDFTEVHDGVRATNEEDDHLFLSPDDLDAIEDLLKEAGYTLEESDQMFLSYPGNAEHKDELTVPIVDVDYDHMLEKVYVGRGHWSPKEEEYVWNG